MKNCPHLTIIKNYQEDPSLLYGAKILEYWVKFDWKTAVYKRYPEIKLTFEDNSVNDWLLYRLIDKLASYANASFPLAAHWVVRHVLGNQFNSAREMNAGERPWDAKIQYACRVVSLQTCKNNGPTDVHTLDLVDYMIRPLLMTDDDTFIEMKAANSLPC